jgi:hypothetical protein
VKVKDAAAEGLVAEGSAATAAARTLAAADMLLDL